MNKNIIASLLVLGFSFAAQAQNVVVPSQFHGFWERSNFCEKALELGMAEVGAEINSTEYISYEEPCEVKQVTTISQQSLKLDLHCASPDGNYESAAEIKLIDVQQLIITRDGNSTEPLVRCK